MLPAERRYTKAVAEVRQADTGMRIGGYAAKFNRLSQNLGGFVERIDPKFFDKSQGDGWPGMVCRHQHEDLMLLGTVHGRTLDLNIDGVGLDYEANLPSTRRDVYELVERGDVHQSSFAFMLPPRDGDDWGTTEDGFPLRTLLTGKALDVASVTIPAYVDTNTGLRSLASHVEAEFEEIRKAAEAGELVRFLPRPKKVIDLAATKVATSPIPVSAETIAQARTDHGTAVAELPAAEAPGVKGQVAGEKAGAAAGETEHKELPDSGQSETHPLVLVRRRRAELLKRRVF